MENQHRLISGYRELDESEIALMNEIKAEGARLDALCARVREHLYGLSKAGAFEDVTPAHNPYRWVSIGVTDFQTGLMALIRAVAQPQGF